jgi:4-hydroxybenzoyl-CoA reductase subunit beta
MTAPLSAFRLAQPGSVEEAVTACLKHPGSRFIAGGTDLLVNMRRGISSPALLVDLSGIDELTEITTDGPGVTIGAGVTIAALARNTVIATRYHALAQAAAAIAGPGHRAMGTIGGNLCLDTRCIYYNQSEWWRKANAYCLKNRGDTCHVAPQGKRCHAAYSGDLAPALLALGAEIDITGAQGHRRISLSELYVEDGQAHLTLAEGELIVAIHLQSEGPASAYAKARVRGAIDFPLAGVAVALAASDRKIGSLRIALTGTNSRPFLVTGTESFAGRSVDEKLLVEIERLVQKQVQPMRTTIASANYRRVVAAALARRLTESLFAECTARTCATAPAPERH